MKKRRSGFNLFVAIFFVMLGLCASPPSTHAQDNPNTITFDNKSGEPALVKLIGPTMEAVEVPNGESRTVNTAAGEYYILTRYGSRPGGYKYAKGDQLFEMPKVYELSKIQTFIPPPMIQAPPILEVPKIQPLPPKIEMPPYKIEKLTTQMPPLFHQRGCVVCHDHTGGYGVAAMFLDPRPQDFKRKPREEIRGAIVNGIPGTAMIALPGLPSASEVEELVDYVLAIAATTAPTHPLFVRSEAERVLSEQGMHKDVEYILEVLRRNGMAYTHDRGKKICIEIGQDGKLLFFPLGGRITISMDGCPRK